MGIKYRKRMFNISEVSSGNHMDTVFCNEIKDADKYNASAMASNYSHS